TEYESKKQYVSGCFAQTRPNPGRLDLSSENDSHGNAKDDARDGQSHEWPNDLCAKSTCDIGPRHDARQELSRYEHHVRVLSEGPELPRQRRRRPSYRLGAAVLGAPPEPFDLVVGEPHPSDIPFPSARPGGASRAQFDVLQPPRIGGD